MTPLTFPRFTAGLVAAISLSFSLAAVAQTVTKEKTHTIVIQYSLAAGASTGLLGPLPVGEPVIVTGNCTNLGDIGIGQVVMHNIPTEALQWIGGDTHDGAVSSYSAVAGTKIMSIDFDGDVQLQVQQDSDTSLGFGFIIKNTSGATLTGEVRVIE